MRIDGTNLKDEHGRTLILRGVNLGGSSKVPFRPDGATYIREGFYEHRNVSFVGRPFPLEDADEHFRRLQAWGLTFLRLQITWEAVEHAGPGIYDQEYLDYLYALVRKAGEHGLQLFIDPHQDVWSRMCGGDGAPGWTFEALGMDVTRFSDTGAAIVHAIHGDPLPRMIWPTNYAKLACATMFTLFFAGDDFAPRTRVDGEPVQGYLQRHYLEAMKEVAARLAGRGTASPLQCVVGYEVMNEPSPGYIGWADLGRPGGLLLGECPSPFQSMLLGAGFPQDIGVWEVRLTGARQRERRRVNPHGQRVWREGQECVWRENGVWDVDGSGQPRLLRPDYFATVQGRPVDFAQDYLRPFANRYAQEIRSVAPDAIIFVAGVPGACDLPWGPQDAPNVVHAGHWYDGLTLFTKTWRPYLGIDFKTQKLVLGPARVRRSFVQQLARFRAWSEEGMGGVPTLIGEFGIPFDMDGKRAYHTGDFRQHAAALDASFRAMEANLLSCTLWNYTADNDNLRGDQWNDEDLSIFSRDQRNLAGGRDTCQHDEGRDVAPERLHDGGRALEAVIRPYARAVAGEPLRMSFDRRPRTFELEFRHDPGVHAPTEVFLPQYQYPDGCVVGVSDGSYKLDHEGQALLYRHGTERDVHRIRVRPR